MITVDQSLELRVENASALVLCGSGEDHSGTVSKFSRYLVDEAGFQASSVHQEQVTNRRSVHRELRRFFRSLGNNEVAVVYYYGHGWQRGITPTEYTADGTQYERIALHFTRPFIFILDSCYSGSAIGVFSSMGLLPRRGLVLASSRSDEISRGSEFTDGLLNSLQNSKPYDRKTVQEPYVLGMTDLRVGSMKEKLKPGEKAKPFPFDRLHSEGGNQMAAKDRILIYKEIKVRRDVQHPVRSGRHWDYLLFAK